MSKAERYESTGYFGRRVIRLERLEDRIKCVWGGEEVGKLIWNKMKTQECHAKSLNMISQQQELGSSGCRGHCQLCSKDTLVLVRQMVDKQGGQLLKKSSKKPEPGQEEEQE